MLPKWKNVRIFTKNLIGYEPALVRYRADGLKKKKSGTKLCPHGSSQPSGSLCWVIRECLAHLYRWSYGASQASSYLDRVNLGISKVHNR